MIPTMIRRLGPLDLIRCALLSGLEKLNRANTLSSLVAEKSSSLSQAEMSRAGLSLRGKGSAWVRYEGNRMTGLVAARQRSGPKSWEITQLFAGEGREEALSDLLERVSQSAASGGAERVFVRLLREDPIVYVARRGGFFPSVPEVLLRGAGESPAPANGVQAASLREITQADSHEVFRLYNATTPPEIRRVAGMTYGQWLDSREPAPDRPREFALSREGRLTGWLRVGRRSGVGHLAAMAVTEEERGVEVMTDFGLGQLKDAGRVYCLAPEYQVGLLGLLDRRGFKPVAEHISMVKTLAIASDEEARVRVAMPSD